MDKIIFERDILDDDKDLTNYNGEPIRIIFEMKSGLKIEYFKVLCKRLASAIGYSENSIERAFGDETLTFEEIEAQVKMRSLIKKYEK